MENQVSKWASVFIFVLISSLQLAGQETKQSDETTEESKPNAASRPKDEQSKPKAGQSVAQFYHFKEADKKMTYQLFLPKDYYEQIAESASKKFPLIVALHGYGSNPKQIVGYPGLTRQANKRGYIIVAPMGYNQRGWYGSHGQKGGYGDDPKNIGELSEKDVMNVLEITQKEFQIDSQRIYIYGHSMGGAGSLHLAIKYPEKWAAIASMAPATPWGLRQLSKAKSLPFFVVHGDKDKVLPVKNTRKLIEKMKELEIEHVYKEVPGGNHVFVAWQYLDEIFNFFDKHQKKNGKP